MAEQTITEIGLKNGIVRIAYEEIVGQDTHEVRVESPDEPRKAFMDALDAMAIHAARLMEIPVPEEYVVGLTVRSVKIKPKDDGSWGLVVSCIKKLSGGQVLSLNTAYTEDVPDSDSAGALPVKCIDAVNALVIEAEAYLDGKRAQGDLFEREEKPDGKSAAAG